MRLTSPRFNWNPRLQLAADNNPPMKSGDQGLYVRHVQQALIDLHFPLPISTAAHGTPDGDFGNETKTQVIEFQRAQKRLHSDFSVDGIVGQQTMGVFDRSLLTPVTLPPIPTPGGATNANANLKQSIIAVLNDSRLSDVTFNVLGVNLSRGSYLQVRGEMEAGTIHAEVQPMPAAVRGFYLAQAGLDKVTGAVLIQANSFVMPFSRATSNEQLVTVVHEATHAFCDFRQIGRPGTAAFTRDQSESVAHIAQASFHRILTGGAETDSLTSDPTKGLNPIFLKADELAQRVLAKDPLPPPLVGELHNLVRQSRTVQGLGNTTNFDGV